ncbi:MAG: peptide transporter [Kiritimatiellaeota bacterium]|nr:peptide transporter [Kiritimatiellota bacterium]
MARIREQLKDLEEYRNLMEVPVEFEDGFNWVAFMGAVFLGLVMVPGSMYMTLLAGRGIGGAANWVTVILFIEVAKRANKVLKKPELFVLFYLASGVMATPFSGLLWRQFFVQSDAAAAYGLTQTIPTWYAPQDPAVLGQRSFFMTAWLPAIALIIFQQFVNRINNLVVGYGWFRLTSDVERLPFPMAPVGASGMMALAEDAAESGKEGEETWRWRYFCLGGAMGLAFGAVRLGWPALTGALFGEAIMIFPIPFVDWTQKTGSILPAFASGLAVDLGIVIFGMVLPFWAMVGGFVGLIITLVANPLLYRYGVLSSWRQGDDTIVTLFKNNIDFYFSFSMGVAFALAIAGIVTAVLTIREMRAEGRIGKKADRGLLLEEAERIKRRGDIRARYVVLVYLLTTIAYITVSGFLIHWHRGVMLVLIFYGLFFTPVISYISIRLEAVSGMRVTIPYVREISFIFSGFKGVEIWFLPIPFHMYNANAIFYRQAELTGTRFRSIWKAEFFLFPIIILSSIFFANYIWSLSEIPSSIYPYVQKMWPFTALNQSVIYSATTGGYSLFQEALRFQYIFVGLGLGVLMYAIFMFFGFPITFIYGIVAGLNQTMPHQAIPQFTGALLGRYYFQKRIGKNWKKYIVVLSAGFACGGGLIAMLCIGITFLQKAVFVLPF